MNCFILSAQLLLALALCADLLGQLPTDDAGVNAAGEVIRYDPRTWYIESSPLQNDCRRHLCVSHLGALLEFADLTVRDKHADESSYHVAMRNELQLQAVIDLGSIGHSYAIPALLAALRDEGYEDDDNIRRRCIYALAFTRDKRVVGYLIEQLTQFKQLNGYSRAFLAELNCTLYHVTRRAGFDPNDLAWRTTSDGRELHQQGWRTWWDENRESTELTRRREVKFRLESGSIPWSCNTSGFIREDYADDGSGAAEDADNGGKQPISALEWLDTNRRNLAKDLNAGRPLHLWELEALLRFADVVIDKRADHGERHAAIRCLGMLGHKYAIPPLLAVLRDKSESFAIRDLCITALAATSDIRVVGLLINEMAPIAESDAGSLRVVRSIESVLRLLTRHEPVFEDGVLSLIDEEMQIQRQNAWISWWRENSSTAKLLARRKLMRKVFSSPETQKHKG